MTSLLSFHAGTATRRRALFLLASTIAPVVLHAQSITLGGLSHIYDGNGKSAQVTTNPAGLNTQVTYTDLSLPAPGATPQYIFRSGPDTLDLSYFSYGLAATGYWELAKFIRFPSNTPRKLHSSDVTLVTWAKHASYATWRQNNPTKWNASGWYHPVTLRFYHYDWDPPQTWTFLTEKTVEAFIPWRPLTLPDGSAYPYNGYAFRVNFDFQDGILFSGDVWVSIGFNTQNTGPAKLNVAGPYNELNVANASSPTVGADVFPSQILYKKVVNNVLGWYSSAGSSGPMVRLLTVPTNATTSPPVNAGQYAVQARILSPGVSTAAANTLSIAPAPLAISLSQLQQIRDGFPKPVAVATVPNGIPVAVTYNGSTSAPSGLGTYSVSAVSANANYSGSQAGQLKIGDNYASWMAAAQTSGMFPAGGSAQFDDPDDDNLPNILEYAFGLHPTRPDSAPHSFDSSGGTCRLRYRLNPHATDLAVTFQKSTDLSTPGSWQPATPSGNNILSSQPDHQIHEAVFPRNPDEPRNFYRLLVAP